MSVLPVQLQPPAGSLCSSEHFAGSVRPELWVWEHKGLLIHTTMDVTKNVPFSKVIYFVWFRAPKAGADCSFGFSHVVGPSLVKWGSGGHVVLSEHLTPRGFVCMHPCAWEFPGVGGVIRGCS